VRGTMLHKLMEELLTGERAHDLKPAHPCFSPSLGQPKASTLKAHYTSPDVIRRMAAVCQFVLGDAEVVPAGKGPDSFRIGIRCDYDVAVRDAVVAGDDAADGSVVATSRHSERTGAQLRC
jgi:hypothetical protein